jgi:hypothetical protein
MEGKDRLKLLKESTNGKLLNRFSCPRRVPMKIEFKVVGTDENGGLFEDRVQTVNVSAGGGCLLFHRDARPGEILQLFSPKGIMFTAQVRWFELDPRSNLRFLGFKLVEPLDMWVLSGGGSSLRG